MRDIIMSTISAGPDQSPRHIGEKITADDREAAALVTSRHAEYAVVKPPEKAVIAPAEKEVVKPPETAEAPAADAQPEKKKPERRPKK